MVFNLQINQCSLAVGLAYFATAYLGASIFYYIVTRSYGTPFKDSLTPQQLQIKKDSAGNRYNAFCTGMFLSVLVLIIIRPFTKCL